MKSKNLKTYRNLRKRGFSSKLNPDMFDIDKYVSEEEDWCWERFKNNPVCPHWLKTKKNK